MNRYDTRARLVLHYAREESRMLGHLQIEPEHLLLGLLREGGPASVVLTDADVTLENARHLTRKLVEQNTKKRSRIDLTSQTLKVMKLAGLEAERLGSECICAEHILLVLLRGDGENEELVGTPSDPGIKRILRATRTNIEGD